MDMLPTMVVESLEALGTVVQGVPQTRSFYFLRHILYGLICMGARAIDFGHGVQDEPRYPHGGSESDFP